MKRLDRERHLLPWRSLIRPTARLRVAGVVGIVSALSAGTAWSQVAYYEDLILARQGAVVDYHGHLPGIEPVTPQLAAPGTSTTTVAGGGQARDVEGNYKRYRQYVTPAEGGYIAEVGTSGVGRDGQTVFSMAFHNPTEDDRWSQGLLEYLPYGTDFSWNSYRSRFFRHFRSDDGRFERRELEVDFSTPFGREVDFDLGVRHVAEEGMDTRGTTDWEAITSLANAYWTHGDLEAEGTYTHERFDQGGPELGGTEDTFNVVLAPARNYRYMFEASSWWRSDDFEDLAPDLNHWTDKGGALSLTASVTSDLLFYGKLYTQHISNAVTQNTYARNRSLASANLAWSGLNWLTLEGGGDLFETDYVDRFHSFTDEPQTAVLWTKVHARPCQDLKLYASYIDRDIDAVPPSTLANRTTGPPVLWDRYHRVRADATYSIATRAAISYDFTEARWRVSAQNEDTRLTTHTGTTWWSPSRDWTLYGSVIKLNWGASGPGGVGVKPSDFTTDIDIVALGATYQLSKDSVANANYTHSSGYGAVRTKEDVWDASWKHQLDPKTQLTVRYQFDQFDEFSANPSKDFRIHLFGVELGRGF